MGINFTSLVEHDFDVGLVFAASFTENFSSSWIGSAFPDKFVNTVHNSNPRLNLNFHAVSSVVIAEPNCQTVGNRHRAVLLILRVHIGFNARHARPHGS